MFLMEETSLRERPLSVARGTGGRGAGRDGHLASLTALPWWTLKSNKTQVKV